jgi:hypothetical protein
MQGNNLRTRCSQNRWPGLALKLVVGGLGNHVALVNGLKEWIIMGSEDKLDNSRLWNHGFPSPCWRIGQ